MLKMRKIILLAMAAVLAFAGCNAEKSALNMAEGEMSTGGEPSVSESAAQSELEHEYEIPHEYTRDEYTKKAENDGFDPTEAAEYYDHMAEFHLQIPEYRFDEDKADYWREEKACIEKVLALGAPDEDGYFSGAEYGGYGIFTADGEKCVYTAGYDVDSWAWTALCWRNMKTEETKLLYCGTAFDMQFANKKDGIVFDFNRYKIIAFDMNTGERTSCPFEFDFGGDGNENFLVGGGFDEENGIYALLYYDKEIDSFFVPKILLFDESGAKVGGDSCEILLPADCKSFFTYSEDMEIYSGIVRADLGENMVYGMCCFPKGERKEISAEVFAEIFSGKWWTRTAAAWGNPEDFWKQENDFCETIEFEQGGGTLWIVRYDDNGKIKSEGKIAACCDRGDGCYEAAVEYADGSTETLDICVGKPRDGKIFILHKSGVYCEYGYTE